MPGSPAASPFSYLVLRVVPSLERGERLNVGVVLFCRQRGFLGASVRIDEARLQAFGAATGTPITPLQAARLAEHLDGLVRVLHGDADAGPVAALDLSERFGWLAAPSSTIVQASAVHTGLTADPAATLGELLGRLVG